MIFSSTTIRNSHGDKTPEGRCWNMPNNSEIHWPHQWKGHTLDNEKTGKLHDTAMDERQHPTWRENNKTYLHPSRQLSWR